MQRPCCIQATLAVSSSTAKALALRLGPRDRSCTCTQPASAYACCSAWHHYCSHSSTYMYGIKLHVRGCPSLQTDCTATALPECSPACLTSNSMRCANTNKPDIPHILQGGQCSGAADDCRHCRPGEQGRALAHAQILHRTCETPWGYPSHDCPLFMMLHTGAPAGQLGFDGHMQLPRGSVCCTLTLTTHRVCPSNSQ